MTVWIGVSAAAAASIAPPFDFMIVQGRTTPAPRNEASRLATYRSSNGFRYASAITVLDRSYSRQIGATS